MDIQVQNFDAALSACQSISEKNQRLMEDVETLRGCLNKINANWESNGKDKASYVTELEKQIGVLVSLSDSIFKTTNAIRDYAYSTQQTAATTMV